MKKYILTITLRPATDFQRELCEALIYQIKRFALLWKHKHIDNDVYIVEK